MIGDKMGIFSFFRRKRKKSALEELSARKEKIASELWEYRSDWNPGFIAKNITLPAGYLVVSSEAFDILCQAHTIVSNIAITKKAGPFISQLEKELDELRYNYIDSSAKDVVLAHVKNIYKIAKNWLDNQR
jgi:hypothetical protein